MHRRTSTSLVLAFFTAILLVVGIHTATSEPLPVDHAPVTVITPPNALSNKTDLNTVLHDAITAKYAAATWYLAVAERNRPRVHGRRYVQSGEAQYGSGACGGDLPSCSIMNCESGGNLTVYNKSGSGASGKWQIMHSTWNGYGGYDNAADAPEDVQDARAREIWAGGAGRGAWSC